MNNPVSGPRTLLALTLLLAASWDVLLRGIPWGVNFSAAALLFFAGLGALSWRLRDGLPREAWLLMGLAALTAACLSWRDANDLAALNVLATLAGAGCLTARRKTGELMRLTFLDHLHQGLVQTFHLTAGAGFLLLKDLRPQGEEPAAARRGRAWLGVALAVPALLVFGSLLSDADAAFEYLVKEVLRIDFWSLIGHALLIGFLGWGIGGYLRGRFLSPEIAPPVFSRPKGLSLSITEVAIVLGALDLLFVSFVLVQLPYFFGGHGTVLGTDALTYAEYARRGFFELIAVAFLSLPLLLLADWLLRTESPNERRAFRALAVGMVVLLGVMLASALHRLALYVEVYGLTQARLHALAILVWVGATLVLFCVTVLRGKRRLFPFSMAVSAFVVLLGLNALNPDALVARVNVARLAQGREFDARASIRLGADAAPALLDALPLLNPEDRSVLARQLLDRYLADPSGDDVRTWNAARARARSLVREHEAALQALVSPPRPERGGAARHSAGGREASKEP
jgi:hypothetical protein